VVGIEVLQHRLKVELSTKWPQIGQRQWCASLSWSGVTEYFGGGSGLLGRRAILVSSRASAIAGGLRSSVKVGYTDRAAKASSSIPAAVISAHTMSRQPWSLACSI
jgi:hypothetical protein